MDAALKQKWIEALRSGKYEQGQRSLRNGDSFCCLGVLCDVSGLGEWGSDAIQQNVFKFENTERVDVLSTAMLDKIGLGYDVMDVCWRMNDREHKSFAEIADYIEANIPASAAP